MKNETKLWDKDEALALLEKEPKEKEKPMMLLSTVNCSIGNK